MSQTVVCRANLVIVLSPCNQMSQVETKDALLHAINEEYVEAVEVLLDHEESIHVEGEPWSWETLSEQEVTLSLVNVLLLIACSELITGLSAGCLAWK